MLGGANAAAWHERQRSSSLAEGTGAVKMIEVYATVTCEQRIDDASVWTESKTRRLGSHRHRAAVSLIFFLERLIATT
jgi:hypothetical protein